MLRTMGYNANQLEIKQQIKDPENTQGFSLLSLRKNLWDEEDRLRAVDLSPENDEDKPLVAVYTYDASGERSIKYVPGRLDARYSAKERGKSDRLESMLYPNPLLSAKTLPIPEMRRDVKDPKLLNYTKHYYIGSERITSVIGSKRGLGAYPGQSETTVPLNIVEDIVDAAGTAVQGAVAHFGKTIILPQPFRFSSGLYNGSDLQDPENYAAFWYHPDHLGSSSYITNLAGEITQHMEYLPFGETLIEEHLNSNNSPYKFNAKEMDAETGNYYYGARYYDPKWSIWLSVDPLFAKYPTLSPFVYTAQNPVIYIDPNGKEIILPGSKKAQDAYVKMLYTSTGNNYAIVDNKLTLNGADANFKGTKSQTLINTIQSGMDSKEVYTMSLVGDRRDNNEIFIDSYSEMKIDISDLKTLGDASTALQGAAIGHFLNEVQVGGEFDPAHQASLGIEGQIYGELVGDNTITARRDYATGAPENGFQNVIYEYNSKNKYQLKQGATSTTKGTGQFIGPIEVKETTVMPTGELKSAKKEL